MAIHDYRFDPFENTFNIKKIFDETHTIPNNSPYTIHLSEVPQKTSPTTVQIKFQDGTMLTEVSEEPTQGQYWPDYLTTEHGIEGWNTGTIKFSAADAGKVVKVTYNGMGTLTDDRLVDQVEISVTSSTQPDREAIVMRVASWDNTTYSGPVKHDFEKEVGHLKTHRGIPAGTYSLRRILQELVNRSHTQEYTRSIIRTNCNCDCSDDSGGN
ncbi:MAG: hypothetical protein ACLVJS_04310 [Acidaminococcus intestini]